MKVKDPDEDNVVMTFSEICALFKNGKRPSNKNRSKGSYLYGKKEGVSENISNKWNNEQYLMQMGKLSI